MKLLDIQEPGQPQEEGQQFSFAIGIDLGTTNSLAAVSQKGEAKVIEKEKESIVPSVVEYRNDGTVIVGNLAKSHLINKEGFIISSVKRLMGRNLDDLKESCDYDKFNLAETNDQGNIWLNAGTRKVTPVQVSAEILKELKNRAEAELKEEITKAVITVPAYFDDAARNATKNAAQLAGLEVLRLINEPTAAALAYGLDKGSEGIYAVYDLGGGTFDISLLNMEKGVFQVLATAGDIALGGDDFDREIAAYFVKHSGYDKKLTTLQLNYMLAVARNAKEYLTDKNEGDFSFELSSKKYNIYFNRQNMERVIEPYVSRTINIARNVIEDSGVEKVKGVVMVGGSTRTPYVRNKVKQIFGMEPLTDVDPDKVVAIGAALQAEALTQGSDTLLLDVLPLSLGLETMGGIVEKLIYRNNPIPIAKSQEFTTYQDGQTAMKIHVLQGEREMAEQCRSLAKFDLTGIPPMKAGIPKIKVTFTVDADGLLTVSAIEQTTGTQQKVEVKPSYGLTDSEIEKMLRESMENAKADITNRLLIESRVEAEQAVKKVEEAIREHAELLDKAERKTIEEQMSGVKKLLSTNDRDDIDAAVHELNRICGDFAERIVNHELNKALKGKNIKNVEKSMP